MAKGNPKTKKVRLRRPGVFNFLHQPGSDARAAGVVEQAYDITGEGVRIPYGAAMAALNGYPEQVEAAPGR
jgi:hypothetical protein